MADLRAALGRQHDDIVEYIRTGTRKPAPSINVRNPLGTPLTAAQRTRLAESHRKSQWKAAVKGAVRDWLPMTRAMTAEQRDRLGRLLDPMPYRSAAMKLDRWLDVALHAPSGSSRTTMLDVEEAGSWLGFTPEDLIRYVFCHLAVVPPQAGFDEWVHERVDVIRAVMIAELDQDPTHWERLAWGGAALLTAFRTELAANATATAKGTRAAARPALDALGFAAIEDDLKAVATRGQSASRAHAIGLLIDAGPAERRGELTAWVNEHCADDRAKSVRDAVEAVNTDAAADEPGAVELPAIDFAAALPADIRERLLAATEPAHARTAPGWHETRIDDAIAIMEGRPPSRRGSPALWDVTTACHTDRTIAAGLAPAHVARLLIPHGRMPVSLGDRAAEVVRATGHPTPLELLAVAAHEGTDGDVVDHVIVNVLGGEDAGVWDARDVATWVRHRSSRLEAYLTTPTDPHSFNRKGLLRAFAIGDRPESLTRSLIRCGLTGHKADRPEARRLLGPGVIDRVIPSLQAGKVDERVGAAVWLRELKDPAAAEPLRAAIEREHHDTAKAQMLAALEAVGGSLDDYLSPERLLADAEAALAKKGAIPTAIDGLSFDALPPVHWRDGSVVSPLIFQWFAAQAVKAKTVEPSALLRRYAGSMVTAEANHFAEALFHSWIRKDLEPAPRAVCEQQARDFAATMIEAATRNPANENHKKWLGLTVEQGMMLDLPRRLSTPVGSAIDSKGLLSVVAAMGGPALASPAHAYLKTWRGNRLHQGKAMVQMLAWIEHPAAIQVVLTIAQRFRPKSIQQEAEVQAGQLAERRGWTVEDLADRTVPRGGFDDDGRQVFDYGTRAVTAHLRDDLTIELIADETGTVIKSLPDPRRDEDAAEVTALQKDLAAAKKEIRVTAALQPERLYVGMCVGRSWAADDFRRYILGNPVMRRLATRLVWIADADGQEQVVRPRSDATLIDIDNEAVTLPNGARVRLAHDAEVDPADAARWIQHLADHATAPLFPQFGRPALPDGTAGPVIVDFKGHVINALTLRGATTKRNWHLGAAMDGGMIQWVQHDFPAGGLSAVLEITGIPAAAQDIDVALLSLYFVKTAAVGNPSRALRLADVPPILLREGYADAMAIAGAGSGYHADYETRITYR